MEGQNFPYDPSNAHADSSSRAIATDPSHPLEPTHSHTSGLIPTTSRTSRSRRHAAPNEQINAPLRQHIWTAKRQWTRSQLERERREFFETRVTGHSEIWTTLKTVVELLANGDVSTAQSIIDAAGITVPTGNLKNGAYDEAGNLYHLPEHIISDPQNVVLDSRKEEGTEDTSLEATDDEEEIQRRRDEKGKGVVAEGDSVKVKARLSDRGGPDVVVSIGRGQTVRSLIRRIQEELNVSFLASSCATWLLTDVIDRGRG